MNIKYILMDKDLSKASKYVVTPNEDLPSFISTASNGEIPLYLSTSTYGSVSIKHNIKLIGRKGHLSTMFPTKFKYNNCTIYSGDVFKTNDLILLLSNDDFHQVEMLVFKDSKMKKWEIIKNLSNGALDAAINLIKGL